MLTSIFSSKQSLCFNDDAIRKQHPNLDIRFVFSSSKRKLSKQSKTTYAEWCIKQGFLYADKKIPEDWLIEKPKKEMPLKFNPYKGTKHD